MTDQEVLTTLFVSDDGEIADRPDWWAEVAGWPNGWEPVPLLPDNAAAGILRLMRERDEALQHLAEWGHKVAGAAGMVPDRLVVADAVNYWWKHVQPFLKQLGWFDRPVSKGGERP